MSNTQERSDHFFKKSASLMKSCASMYEHYGKYLFGECMTGKGKSETLG